MTTGAARSDEAAVAERREQVTEWRHLLHRAPELSGQEELTAQAVCAMLDEHAPDEVIAGLGGHGVAAVWRGAAPGPTVMLRAELDALPISETGTAPYSSGVAGIGHLCGHDGHSAILAAVAGALARRRPARGAAVLLFQPAEETGDGAAAVLADPRFDRIRPDLALSLHNMPGLPLGSASLAEGPFACASRGMRVRLSGRTSHSSMPETGLSPVPALARLMPALTALGHGTGGGAGGRAELTPGFRMVTITHVGMGGPAFGIAPGEADLFATLRTLIDADMAALMAEAEALVDAAAAESGLSAEVDYAEVFAASTNAPAATAVLRRALADAGLPVATQGLPMRASEDFGLFSRVAPSAMFLLGAGEHRPALHNSDYDFPDALIPIGARVFLCALRNELG